MRAERPARMARLFEASSQVQTSCGRTRASRSMYSTAAPSLALHCGAEEGEQGAEPVDRVGRGAHRQAERHASGVALLGRGQEGVPGPLFGAGARAVLGRPHLPHVDAGMLLEKIDPPERRLHLCARDGGDCDPAPVALGVILRRVVHRPIFRDQSPHHVVHRHQLIGVSGGEPGWEGEDVVGRSALRLGGDGEFVLSPDRGDEVHLHLDSLARAPGGAELAQRVVVSRYPVVPEAAAQGDAGLAVHRHQRQSARRSAAGDRAEERPTCRAHACHVRLPTLGVVPLHRREAMVIRPLFRLPTRL